MAGRAHKLGWIGALLALLPQLALATVARGVVVCEELDGRSTFEWTLAGCCEAEAAAATHPTGPALGAADECDACTDAPLLVTAVRDAAGPHLTAPVAIALGLASPAPAPLVPARARAERLRSPPSQRELALRSVVIRC